MALALAGIGLPLLVLPHLAAVLVGMVLVGVGTFYAQATATGFVGRAPRDRGSASGLYLASYFAAGCRQPPSRRVFAGFGWTAAVVVIGLALASPPCSLGTSTNGGRRDDARADRHPRRRARSRRRGAADRRPAARRRTPAHGKDVERYLRLRHDIGRAILLGLEVLVAADIVRSVTLAPTMDGLTVLATLVVIRTFLSWSLALELDGRWPWQSHATTPAPPLETTR